MKKFWIILVIAILISVGIFFISRAIYSYNNRYVPPEGNEEIYALTEQEVARINANSNLLGCVLLSEAPEDSTTVYQLQLDRTPEMSICVFRIGEHSTLLQSIWFLKMQIFSESRLVIL